MKVSNQCGIAASKGNQILGLIRINNIQGKKLIIPMYKAIVRPHLEYCIQAWRPYHKKDIDTLERIQRRASKIILELRDLSYEERLKECGLTTLETRRLRGDQIEVFKILNGYENFYRNIFFTNNNKIQYLYNAIITMALYNTVIIQLNVYRQLNNLNNKLIKNNTTKNHT